MTQQTSSNSQIKTYFAFETEWTFMTDDEWERFLVVNQKNQIVARCCKSENIISYCKDITRYEKAIAIGVARINCGLDIPLNR